MDVPDSIHSHAQKQNHVFLVFMKPTHKAYNKPFLANSIFLAASPAL